VSAGFQERYRDSAPPPRSGEVSRRMAITFLAMHNFIIKRPRKHGYFYLAVRTISAERTEKRSVTLYFRAA